MNIAVIPFACPSQGVPYFRKHRYGMWHAVVFCLALFLCAGWSGIAMAQCTVYNPEPSLSNHSALALETASIGVAGEGGLRCTDFLTVGATAYIQVKLESSNLLLTGGPDNQSIPFSISGTQSGLPIAVGQIFDATTSSLLTLFSATNNSLPLYIKTAPTSGLKAGTYQGTVNLRWYYSVCYLAVTNLLCSAYESPAFVRPGLFTALNWGGGVSSIMTITMVVENDCEINAPNLDFGAAPFAVSFGEASQTIIMRCSAGSAYDVGLSDGGNFTNGARHMRRGASGDLLRYEIYQAPASLTRWGNAAGQRRSSTTADNNENMANGTTRRSFTYGARIDPDQPTPPAGRYTDNIVVDVVF